MTQLSKETIETFYNSLVSFILLSKREIVTIGAAHGLTLIQTLTLMVLDENKPQPMNSFCGILGCDASNVTGIIDGLERKSLVLRGPHRDDKRIKAVSLLKEGERIRRAILSELSSEQNYILSKLTTDERMQLSTLFDKITDTPTPLSK